ncbi:MAG: hypothetical protein H0W48_00510 [Methylibium sp.]|nr:hypothetical protein [Methylibium sp.]
MSIVSDALARALGIVAAAKGESLSYRESMAFAWEALPGFVLDRDEPAPPIYEDRDQAEASVRSGRLCGPLSPALVVGYQIQDGSGDVWAVVTVDLDQQQLCGVRLTTLASAGPNRGGAL